MSIVLDVIAPRLLAPALMIAAAIIVKGYADVGDGFSAGVIVALAITLRYITVGTERAEFSLPILRHAPVVATCGLLIALAVGFLPVTCHLTCPVTDYATKTSAATRFESQRFTDFPTVVETLKSGRIQATFMIAPLAMKLREQCVRVKIAYLGHRDGSTVMRLARYFARSGEKPSSRRRRGRSRLKAAASG